MLLKKLVVSALAGGVLFASPVFSAETLKLSHILDRTHPYHKTMEFFAKRANELGGGEINVRVYPNAELGSQREVIELIQNGSIAMGQANVASLEAFAGDYAAFNMPYLFKDRDHFYRVIKSPVAQDILKSTADKGFLGVAYHDNGARSFYGKKAFNSPADLKGVKIRVMPSPIAIRMVELLGANPATLPYGELYTALQQGVVDGAESNPTALTLGRHGEVSKFFSKDEHTMTPDILIISSKVWNKLSDKSKKAIEQAGIESTDEMKKLWAKAEAEAVEKAKKMGVTFVEVNKQPFMDAVQPLYTELEAKQPSVAKLVNEMKAM